MFLAGFGSSDRVIKRSESLVGRPPGDTLRITEGVNGV